MSTNDETHISFIEREALECIHDFVRVGSTIDAEKATALFACIICLFNDDSGYLCTLIAENDDVYDILKMAKLERAESAFIILTAALHKNSKCLSRLLSIGYDVNTQDSNCETPLLIAIRNKDIDSVSIILEHNPDINHVDKYGFSALLCAFIGKQNEIASMLLNINNIDVNAQDHIRGLTSLMICADYYNKAGVMMLLDHPRINVNAQDFNGLTVMMYVMFDSSKVIGKMIMDSGKVDVNITDNDGKTAFWYADVFATDETARHVIEKTDR